MSTEGNDPTAGEDASPDPTPEPTPEPDPTPDPAHRVLGSAATTAGGA